jgi:HPt (histidine-containing phosphotransfer) domain-containing protein
MTIEQREAVAQKAQEWADSCGREFVVHLIDTFLTDAPKRLAALGSAYTAGDIDNFRRAAHTLKSSSGQIGAHSYAETAKIVEMAAREGRMAQSGELVVILERDFKFLRSLLLELRHDFVER